MTKEELNQAWNLLCDLRDELPEGKTDVLRMNLMMTIGY